MVLRAKQPVGSTWVSRRFSVFVGGSQSYKRSAGFTWFFWFYMLLGGSQDPTFLHFLLS